MYLNPINDVHCTFTMNPEVPGHLVSKILLDAYLGIDTRRALRMRPGPVTRLVPEDARSALARLFELRSLAYARFVQFEEAGGDVSCALGGCSGPPIPVPNRPRESLDVSLEVWHIGGRVLMHFEKTRVAMERLGRQGVQPGVDALRRAHRRDRPAVLGLGIEYRSRHSGVGQLRRARLV